MILITDSQQLKAVNGAEYRFVSQSEITTQCTVAGLVVGGVAAFAIYPRMPLDPIYKAPITMIVSTAAAFAGYNYLNQFAWLTPNRWQEVREFDDGYYGHISVADN